MEMNYYTDEFKLWTFSYIYAAAMILSYTLYQGVDRRKAIDPLLPSAVVSGVRLSPYKKEQVKKTA